MKKNVILAIVAGALVMALATFIVVPVFSAEARADTKPGCQMEMGMLQGHDVARMPGTCNMAQMPEDCDMQDMPEGCHEMMANHRSEMTGKMHGDTNMHRTIQDMKSCPMMG